MIFTSYYKMHNKSARILNCTQCMFYTVVQENLVIAMKGIIIDELTYWFPVLDRVHAIKTFCMPMSFHFITLLFTMLFTMIFLIW